MIQNISRQNKFHLAWFGVAIFAALWALRPVWDMDLWWHIALGRFIVESGLPLTDPLALGREGVSWATFQGGYEAFVALLDQWGGIFLVRGVHASAVGVGIALFGRSAQKVSGSFILGLAAAFLLLVLYEDRIRVRPHVFHFLGMNLLLCHLATRNFMWKFKDILWLVPLFVVWSGFHGPASLWGLLLVGGGVLPTWKRRESWAPLAASLAALLLTPGVWRGLVSSFAVHTRPGIQSRFVPEHGTLFDYFNGGTEHGVWVVSLVIVILALGISSLLWKAKKRDFSYAALVFVSVPMGLFSLLFARFAWYAVGPLLVGLIWGSKCKRQVAILVLCGSASLFAWEATDYVLPRYVSLEAGPWAEDIQEGHPHHFPLGATRFLQKAGISGGIYNEVGWGGFLLYNLEPGTRTLYDSRIVFGEEAAQLLIDDDRLVNQRARGLRASKAADRRVAEKAFGTSREGLAKIAERLGADLIVKRVPVFGTPGVANAPVDWHLLYRDNQAEVWALKDEKLSGRLEQIRGAWGQGQVQGISE